MARGARVNILFKSCKENPDKIEINIGWENSMREN